MTKFKKIFLSTFLFGIFTVLMLAQFGFVKGQELSQGPITGPITAPRQNRPPVITPDNLPKAVLNRFSYKGVITVTDPDNDVVTVSIEGRLPRNLRFGECPVTGQGKVECYILGIAKQTGTYSLQVTATDSKGAMTSKTVKLLVVSR